MNANGSSSRVYCVDLAKNKFQVHAFSQQGQRLERKVLTRKKFQILTGSLAPSDLVVMEACASSQHWARKIAAHGARAKLVPAQFVAKQRIGNKNDGNDADAIYAVHRDPRVRPVPVKTVAQQDLCAIHRLRELLDRQRTQMINQARGLLAERGCVAPKGEKGFSELLAGVIASPPEEVTPSLLDLVLRLSDRINQTNLEIADLNRRLRHALRDSAVAQRIDTIFGVGVVTATAVAAEYGNGVGRFADARQFAASLGSCPSERSSGETRRLGAITRQGNPYLRKLLVLCAQSVVRSRNRRKDPLCQLAVRLLDSGKPHNKVVVAVANRLARIMFAVIRDGTEYRPDGAHQPA